MDVTPMSTPVAIASTQTQICMSVNASPVTQHSMNALSLKGSNVKVHATMANYAKRFGYVYHGIL